MTRTDESNVVYIKETLERVLLTQTARSFPFAEANPNNVNFNSWIGVNASINAAGNSLTVVPSARGLGNNIPAVYALVSVHAR